TPPVETPSVGEVAGFTASPPPVGVVPAGAPEPRVAVAPDPQGHPAAPEVHPGNPSPPPALHAAPVSGPDLSPVTVRRDGPVAVEEPAGNEPGSVLDPPAAPAGPGQPAPVAAPPSPAPAPAAQPGPNLMLAVVCWVAAATALCEAHALYAAGFANSYA